MKTVQEDEAEEQLACDIILACGNDGNDEQQTYAGFARLLARRLPELRAQLKAAHMLLVLADDMRDAIPWLRAGDERKMSAVDDYEAARVEYSRAAQLKEGT